MFLREQHPPQRIAFRVLECRFVPVIRRVPAPIRSESARRVRLPHCSHPRPNLLPQPLQIGERQHAFDLHVIHLRQVRPVFQHLRRQVPVICQKHQPRRRIIQSPHGINTFGQSTQAIPQRLAPFRIGHCRHHFRRLVQHDVDAPLLSFHDFPGRFDPVFPRIRFGSQFRHHAPVHAHLSAQDQLLRVPPRRNPRPRNYLLQSLLHVLDFVFFGRPFQSATHCPSSSQKRPSFRAKRGISLRLYLATRHFSPPLCFPNRHSERSEESLFAFISPLATRHFSPPLCFPNRHSERSAVLALRSVLRSEESLFSSLCSLCSPCPLC